MSVGVSRLAERNCGKDPDEHHGRSHRRYRSGEVDRHSVAGRTRRRGGRFRPTRPGGGRQRHAGSGRHCRAVRDRRDLGRWISGSTGPRGDRVCRPGLSKSVGGHHPSTGPGQICPAAGGRSRRQRRRQRHTAPDDRRRCCCLPSGHRGRGAGGRPHPTPGWSWTRSGRRTRPDRRPDRRRGTAGPVRRLGRQRRHSGTHTRAGPAALVPARGVEPQPAEGRSWCPTTRNGRPRHVV
jgi:hypothetical protein